MIDEVNFFVLGGGVRRSQLYLAILSSGEIAGKYWGNDLYLADRVSGFTSLFPISLEPLVYLHWLPTFSPHGNQPPWTVL